MSDYVWWILIDSDNIWDKFLKNLTVLQRLVRSHFWISHQTMGLRVTIPYTIGIRMIKEVKDEKILKVYNLYQQPQLYFEFPT